VFLSHNSQDKPTVQRIAEKLRDAGLEPWLDRWYLAGGDVWQDDLAGALGASAACAVCVGPNGLGDWEREEVGIAQDRATRDRTFRLFPVLLPGLPEPFDSVAVLPPFLRNRVWVDLRKGVESEANLHVLVRAIRGLPEGPVVRSDPQSETSPYRGLRPFEEDHAEFFFGRDTDVQQLLEKLRATRFLAVVAPSGSGKSSLVRAGLVPALRRGELPESGTWPIRILTPGPRPLEVLAMSVARLIADDDVLGRARQLRDLMMQDAQGLHWELLRQAQPLPGRERAVLVIDQFEEVFTLCDSDAERAQFLANVLYAATVPLGYGVIIIALRADFYERCAAYPELAGAVAAHQHLVSPMPPDRLREVIEEPAHLAGLELEDGLVDVILEDVGEEPGMLPLLEHALWEVWQRRVGCLLTLQGYHLAGEVTSALARRADDLYTSLVPEEQGVARRVLLQLAEPGDGTPTTRRRATMHELLQTGGARQPIEAVVHALVDARLLTTSQSERTGEEMVDVAHEALIRHWPRLRGWIDEERQWLRLRSRVRQATNEWREHGADHSFLFGGVRLLELEEYTANHQLEGTDDEAAFLAASRVQERARRRAQYLRSFGELAGGAIGTAAAFGLAFALLVGSTGGAAPDLAVLASLAFLVVFASSLPTGLGIGLGQMMVGRWTGAARAALLGPVAALLSLLSHSLFLQLFLPSTVTISLSQRGLGAWLGLGLGIGAALGRTRRERSATTILGGVLGTSLARLTGGMDLDPTLTLAMGLLLGGLTALGFHLTSGDGFTGLSTATGGRHDIRSPEDISAH
jgi:hypothetical protein